MSKNGIEHKDVPKHRLINAKKIAVNSSVHDYREADKPQLPKQDTMWTWIKKNALKRLLPFVKEVVDVSVDVDSEIIKGRLWYYIEVKVLDEIVFGKEGTKKL